MDSKILCIPDTVDSFEFLQFAKKYGLPLVLLIQKKWEKDIKHLGWPYILVDDFKNLEKTIISIQEFVRKYAISIDRCIAFAEMNIELIGSINDHFFYKGLDKEQALLFRDKYLMKLKASSLGVSTPLFSSYENRHIFYKVLKKEGKKEKKPFVFLIKPRKAWACQGIRKFFSIQEAETYISSLENPHDYIWEKYIDLEMFHVGALICKGKSLFSVVVKHDASVFEMGRSAPEHLILHTIDQNSKHAVLIKQTHDMIAKGFGLQEGITFVEFFYDPLKENVIFCEAAARHPALQVPKLYEIATGKNLFEEYVKVLVSCLKNKDFEYSFNDPYGYAGIINFAALPGKLVSCDDIHQFSEKQIVYRNQPDSLLGTIFNDISFKNTIGRLIIKCSSEKECYNLLKHFSKSFKYRVE